MKPNRRQFVQAVTAGLGLGGFQFPPIKGSAAEEKRTNKVRLSEEHLAAVNRKRRIVVNYDALATLFAFKPADSRGSLAELKYHLLNILDRQGTQIDSVGWCWSEGNEAPYPSKVLPTLLDHPIFMRVPPDIDLVKICCDETRKRGVESFFSYRINGGDHDRTYLQGKLPKLPKKWNNKDWLINWNPDPVGPPEYISPYHAAAFWDFASQELRDYKVHILREVAENYDFDGIEVDFARNSPVLHPGHQWVNRDKLTDFMRSLRFVLQEVAKQRGRPFLISARVPENLVGCHFDGLDVETWAREQLLDIFNLGCRSMEVDIPAFRRITAGTSIKIYPGLDYVHYSDGNDPGDTQAYGLTLARGVFANWWHQQPDGVYTFNYTYPGQNWSAYREIGSPQNLKYMDKTFVIQRRGGGHSPVLTPYPNDWRTPRLAYANTNMLGQLPVSLDHAAKADNLLFMYVADDVEEADQLGRLKDLQLRVLLSQPSSIEVRLNGAVLDVTSFQDTWSEFETNPRLLAVGENMIGICFSDPQEDVEKDVLIEKVELQVVYQVH